MNENSNNNIMSSIKPKRNSKMRIQTELDFSFESQPGIPKSYSTRTNSKPLMTNGTPFRRFLVPQSTEIFKKSSVVGISLQGIEQPLYPLSTTSSKAKKKKHLNYEMILASESQQSNHEVPQQKIEIIPINRSQTSSPEKEIEIQQQMNSLNSKKQVSPVKSSDQSDSNRNQQNSNGSQELKSQQQYLPLMDNLQLRSKSSVLQKTKNIIAKIYCNKQDQMSLFYENQVAPKNNRIRKQQQFQQIQRQNSPPSSKPQSLEKKNRSGSSPFTYLPIRPISVVKGSNKLLDEVSTNDRLNSNVLQDKQNQEAIVSSSKFVGQTTILNVNDEDRKRSTIYQSRQKKVLQGLQPYSNLIGPSSFQFEQVILGSTFENVNGRKVKLPLKKMSQNENLSTSASFSSGSAFYNQNKDRKRNNQETSEERISLFNNQTHNHNRSNLNDFFARTSSKFAESARRSGLDLFSKSPSKHEENINRYKNASNYHTNKGELFRSTTSTSSHNNNCFSSKEIIQNTFKNSSNKLLYQNDHSHKRSESSYSKKNQSNNNNNNSSSSIIEQRQNLMESLDRLSLNKMKQLKQMQFDMTEDEWNMFEDRFPSDYVKLKALGRGGFSIVWLGQHKTTRLHVAVKQISLMNVHQTQRNELWLCGIFFEHGKVKTTFQNVRGISNLLMLINQECTSQDTFLVYELAGFSLGTHLYTLKIHKGQNNQRNIDKQTNSPSNSISNHSQRLYKIEYHKMYSAMRNDLSILKKIIIEVSSAIELLSSQNIVHSDVKTENIILSVKHSEENQSFSPFGVKLIDYGSAFSFSSLKNFAMATPEYMAPEILNYILYTSSSDYDRRLMEYLNNYKQAYVIDVWSLGCVLLELVHGLPLWMSLQTVIPKGQKGKSDSGLEENKDSKEQLDKDQEDQEKDQQEDEEWNIQYGLFAVKDRVFSQIIAKQLDVVSKLDQVITKQNFSGIVLDEQLTAALKGMLQINPAKRLSPSEIISILQMEKKS